MTATPSDVLRQARCASCQTVRPSREWERLAFFENRGPGSDFARVTCRHCQYHDVAHTPAVMARNSALKCTSFEAQSEGHEYDLFYCGCRGWD